MQVVSFTEADNDHRFPVDQWIGFAVIMARNPCNKNGRVSGVDRLIMSNA